jgi:hypothetical protein
MRATCAASAALVMIAGTLLLGAIPAQAASVTPCPRPGDRTARPDVDGDALPDVVVGIPTAVTGGARSGAIDVHLASGGVQRLGPSFFGVPAASGQMFGAQLISIDLQMDDMCHDVAIAAPGSDAHRGAVVLVRGDEAGLVADGAVVLSGRNAGDRFGAALAVGVLTPEGTDLYVGAPGRTVSGQPGAGAVDHYLVPADGGAPSYVGELSQDSPGVPGVSEAGDHFGATLTATTRELVVGVPDEAVGSRPAAGGVEVLSLLPHTDVVVAAHHLAQGYERTPGLAEAGDRFGAALASDTGLLVVGSPGEAVGRRPGVGIVYAYNRFTVERPYPMVRPVTQDTPGIAGRNESGDLFGSSLALVEWCGVAIGSPGEDIGSAVNAGMVSLVAAAAPGTFSCERAFHQGRGGGLGGALESGDRVGSALTVVHERDLALLPHDQLLVGVPGEGVGTHLHAGVVTLLGLALSGPGYAHRSYADSAGPVSGERYGGALLSAGQ